MSDHQCGPAYAEGFFLGVRNAARAAHVSSKYLISCIDHEIDVLGIDFDSQAGITSRSGEGGLVTSFVDRVSVTKRRDLRAYKWLGDTPICFVEESARVEGNFGGPLSDPSFFAAIVELRSRENAEAQFYALTSSEFYKRGLGLKGDDDVAEGTIRDGKVYHRLKDGEAVPAKCVCCTWSDVTGNCNGTWC